jgi:hypothetical protein
MGKMGKMGNMGDMNKMGKMRRMGKLGKMIKFFRLGQIQCLDDVVTSFTFYRVIELVYMLQCISKLITM